MHNALPPDAAVLLTGADTLLGRALAGHLASRVRLLGLVGGGLHRALEADARELELEHPGLSTRTFHCELSHAGDVAELMRRVRGELPRVDVWAHVSSLGSRPGDLGEGLWDDGERLIQAEIRALARLSHAWLEPMIEQRRGGLLWIGSAGATLPQPGAPLRAAGQRFMDGLSESLRVRLVGTGVTLTEVLAGPTTTEVMGAVARGQSPIPLSRFALSPEELTAGALAGYLDGRARVTPGFALRQTLRAVHLLPGPLKRLVFGLATLRVGQERTRAPITSGIPRALLH